MAANQIAITCAASTFMFALGFANAVGIRVGHAWGRGDWPKLRQVGFNGMGCTALVMGSFAVMFLLLRHSIAGLFSPDLEVVSLAASLLMVTFWPSGLRSGRWGSGWDWLWGWPCWGSRWAGVSTN
jgi:MATE family multidrug resistance protein